MHFLINHHLSWNSGCFDLCTVLQIHSTFMMTPLLIANCMEGFSQEYSKLLLFGQQQPWPEAASLSPQASLSEYCWRYHKTRLKVIMHRIITSLWYTAMITPASQGKAAYKIPLQKRIGNVVIREVSRVMWENICTRWLFSSTADVTLKS